jgi:hypothetical protein
MIPLRTPFTTFLTTAAKIVSDYEALERQARFHCGAHGFAPHHGKASFCAPCSMPEPHSGLFKRDDLGEESYAAFKTLTSRYRRVKGFV